jgi:hypothetical protein
MLKTIFVVVLLISSLSSQAAWSYGSSSSSKKKCVAPKITEMQPVNLTKVAPGAAFSFVASAESNPDSLSVTVKEHVVAVTLTPRSSGFLVQGILPEGIQQGFVRIEISASSVTQCPMQTGWLVEVNLPAKKNN